MEEPVDVYLIGNDVFEPRGHTPFLKSREQHKFGHYLLTLANAT